MPVLVVDGHVQRVLALKGREQVQDLHAPSAQARRDLAVNLRERIVLQLHKPRPEDDQQVVRVLLHVGHCVQRPVQSLTRCPAVAVPGVHVFGQICPQRALIKIGHQLGVQQERPGAPVLSTRLVPLMELAGLHDDSVVGRHGVQDLDEWTGHQANVQAVMGGTRCGIGGDVVEHQTIDRDLGAGGLLDQRAMDAAQILRAEAAVAPLVVGKVEPAGQGVGGAYAHAFGERVANKQDLTGLRGILTPVFAGRHGRHKVAVVGDKITAGVVGVLIGRVGRRRDRVLGKQSDATLGQGQREERGDQREREPSAQRLSRR